MQGPDKSAFDDEGNAMPDHVESSVGQLLRAARLKRGLSVEDAARQLRLSVRQIVALEEDDYAKLVSGTFVRGFVRNYAKLLQLDETPLLQQLDQAVPATPHQTISYPVEGIPFPSNRKYGKGTLIIGVGIFLALLLLIYEVYRGSEANIGRQPSEKIEPEIAPEPEAEDLLPQPRGEVSLGEAGVAPSSEGGPSLEQKRMVPPAIPPQAEHFSTPFSVAEPRTASPERTKPESAITPFAQEPGSGGQHAVRLIFEGESWVEARDGRGRLLLSRINPGGTEQVLQGVPPFSLTIGNAAEVKLVYNNKPVDLAPHTNAFGGTARLSLE